MASINVIDSALTYLATAYDKRLDETRRFVYSDALLDMDDDLLTAAVRHVVGTCKFFPSVAEIRSAASELSKWSNRVPTSAEAWQEVLEMPRPHTYKVLCPRAIEIDEAARAASTRRDATAYNAALKTSIVHDRTCTDCHEDTTRANFSHQIIFQVATRLGWPNHFFSDEIGVDRGRFIKTYEAEVMHLTAQASALPGVMSYVDERRLFEDDRRSADRQERSRALDRGERGVQYLADRLSK